MNNPYNQSGPVPFNRNYVNCPTCGRSMEMSEVQEHGQAMQQAISKLPPDVQKQLNNTMQPMPSCKVCKSQMNQSLQQHQQTPGA
jgi:uncharacterized Zn finger protein (UPF0148 family)